VQRFRGGLVFKAHRLYVPLKSRLESNKEEEEVSKQYSQALTQSIWSHKFGETRLFPAPKLTDSYHQSSTSTEELTANPSVTPNPKWQVGIDGAALRESGAAST